MNVAHSVHKNSSSNSLLADFLPIKGEQVPTHAYTISNLDMSIESSQPGLALIHVDQGQNSP